LIWVPATVEVTFKTREHSAGTDVVFAGTEPPLMENVFVPGTAVTVPPQELLTTAGFTILIFGGMTSV